MISNNTEKELKQFSVKLRADGSKFQLWNFCFGLSNIFCSCIESFILFMYCSLHLTGHLYDDYFEFYQVIHNIFISLNSVSWYLSCFFAWGIYLIFFSFSIYLCISIFIFKQTEKKSTSPSLHKWASYRTASLLRLLRDSRSTNSLCLSKTVFSYSATTKTIKYHASH